MAQLVLALVFLSVVAVHCDGPVDVYAKYRDVCLEQEKPDKAHVEKLFSELELVKNPSQNMKCFLACTVQHLEYMSKEGEWIPENINAKLSEEKRKAVPICIAKQEQVKERCEKAYQMFMCATEHKAHPFH